ncbi:MAG: hypothetical protein P4L76_17820 [Beijerinckiaceae bacterium]|nr:hypothetical protein [Beijerinckiaceae bacterium]
MSRKSGYGGGDQIGVVKGVNGTSMELNTQRMIGGEKPAFTGKASPGDSKPPMVKEAKVPMPK